jgi:hypothetical protein
MDDDWRRYYEQADDRRRKNGGDPFKRFIDRQTDRERAWLFVGVSVLLALCLGFYFVLMR